MNKELAIVFSDPHIHKYKQFNEGNRRLNNGIALLDYIFKLADTNWIKYILMPGDLYNLMQIINTEVVNAVVSCFNRNFKQYPDIQFIAISGNHDMANKNLLEAPAESALEHLTEIFDNFMLLDKGAFVTKEGVIILGIPYYEYPEHFRNRLEDIPKDAADILLMHQVVASGLPIEDDIDAGDPLFKNFTMIFNGHIHKSQEVTDNFINVGSPMHRDAGDIGVRKGIWIVDLCDPLNTLSFKDITDKFPQFIHKEQGAELSEWESKQYVIWQPPVVAGTVEDKKLTENFRTDLTPSTIILNYCTAVKADQQTLEYGLNLIGR